MESSAIQKRIDLLEKAEAEYKTKKDMVQQSLQHDEELLTLDEKLKDSKRRHQAHKQALLNEPELRKLQEDMKDLSIEIRDTKKLLGDELLGYFMKNQTLEYVDASGAKRRFTVSARFTKGKEE